MSDIARYEDEDIEMEIVVDKGRLKDLGIKLNETSVYRSIVDSPWIGNTPLSSCLKSGEKFDWEFRYAEDLWIKWWFILKTRDRRGYHRAVKTAVREILEGHHL